MNSVQKLLILNSRKPQISCFYQSVRPLFRSSVLGIDSFVERRKKFRESFKNPELYKSRLKTTCEFQNGGNGGIVFSYDVMNLVHLIENEQELDILNKVLKKMCSQTKIKVVKNVFGSEVMRLYHIMNKPNEAIALIKDPELYSEFENIATFSIFLDMLFKNKLYEDVVMMYEYHMINSTFSVRSYLLNLLYFAACYKLNTETSLEKAVSLWKTLIHNKCRPGMKIKLLFAALLLKQNQIISAMDVLQMKVFNNVAENLKCLSLIMSDRFHDAFDKIRENVALENNKFFMFKEVADYVEDKASTSNEENKMEFLKIKEELVNNNLIIDEALDKYICENLEIKTKK